eukprot:3273161-Alexandrium_andersonii.AAC.1
MEVAQHSAPAAPGLDSWKPRGLAVLGLQAFSWLAALLSCIERGGNWPVEMLQARAAILAKPDASPHDIMGYRLLTALSACCRLWGKPRVSHVRRRADRWNLECLYAGT